jgi:hypothetical protein
MRISSFGRYALTCCVAVAMLAGCSASQQPIGAPGAMPQASAITTHADHGGSWMLPEAKSEDLLYSGSHTVYVFSYPSGKMVGSLDPGTPTNGLCSDNKGNVFLTGQQGSSLTEYAHGGSQPIAYLTIPNGEGGAVFGCAVDPTTGNLAASFECNNMSQCASGNEIAVFPNASGTPTEYGGSGLPPFRYCGYDDVGNLFADGLAGYEPILAELPEGSSKFKSIRLNKSMKKVGQIQWDGTYMTIQDRLRASLYRLKISGSTAKVEGTTEFDEKGLAGQSWVQGGSIVMPYRHSVKTATTLGFWKYPAGGTPTKTVSKKSWGRGGLGAFTGTTVSVAAKR